MDGVLRRGGVEVNEEVLATGLCEVDGRAVEKRGLSGEASLRARDAQRAGAQLRVEAVREMMDEVTFGHDFYRSHGMESKTCLPYFPGITVRFHLLAEAKRVKNTGNNPPATRCDVIHNMVFRP